MFEEVKYGFWKQKDPKPFEYSPDYTNRQSTNLEMSYLRLGWLSSHIRYIEMKQMTVVDIGAGNRSFYKACLGKFKNVYAYDVCGDSISRESLYSTKWDLIVLSDVLEHFDDINDLYKMNWKYAFISFPETPKSDSVDQLSTWRHFKPDEHIWCLTESGMKQWLNDNNCEIIASNTFEDLIRKRWDESLPNITSILVKNNQKKEG